LKRHFQKCSIRRGNPTGASHLSHPQAHVKKNAAAQQKAAGLEGDVNHMNGMANMSSDGMVPFGLMPGADAMTANDQAQRGSNRLDDANRDRRAMAGSVMGGSARGGSFDQHFNGDVSANINPQLANYSMPSAQNGMPMFGGTGSAQQSNLDWSQMFQAGAHNAYENTFPPNDGQTQIATKQEPNTLAASALAAAAAAAESAVPNPDASASLPDDPNSLPDWGVPSSYPDPYQQLSNQILDFFYPPGLHQPYPATSADMRSYFQPQNIRVFLANFTHFHVHFALLHIPTFRIMDAYVGLLASMCCIGACYSTDHISPASVREMTDALKTAIERSSHMYASLSDDVPLSVKYDYASFGSKKQDIEEMQALILSHILCVWHGTPAHRERARRSFPLMATLARKANLLRVSPPNSNLYSHLHQPDIPPQSINPADFDWYAWTEQEKRVHVMFAFFLCDAAFGLYFNTGPEFDALEIQIPLPVDDAAWEARNAAECAQALGLHGPEAARECNPDGTQRYKQPEFHLVMRALLHSSYQIQPGTTNLYGKFIMIHGLLAMLRRAQLEGNEIVIKRSTTPLPQKDWIIGAHGTASGSNSGRATPVDTSAQLLDGATIKTFSTALDKFKSNWDMDMATQFPPAAPTHPRRYGFCRDAVHFYWLATYLLKNTRPSDLQTSPDERFTQVMHLLKSVRDWVMADGASRGERLGSVGDIDRNFGVLDLNLDMAQLFKPLPALVEPSAISSV
jgi:hypothetical protein